MREGSNTRSSYKQATHRPPSSVKRNFGIKPIRNHDPIRFEPSGVACDVGICNGNGSLEELLQPQRIRLAKISVRYVL